MAITYYTGIGARKTPLPILNKMLVISDAMYNLGFILRSGGADGADSVFEQNAGQYKEIYLPWDGFNGAKVDNLYHFLALPEAEEIAKRFHPKWDYLKSGPRKMHTRNVHQVLGKDLRTPSKFVICWTADGKASGGTGQALRIAKAHDIPIFNLYNMSVRDVGKAIYDLMEKENVTVA